MAEESKSIIIIKKKRGGAHGGAHGGAWKVAYADFVTAMMAFFMVLWLMGADEETKQAIAAYFNSPNKFKGSDSVNINGPLAGGDASSRPDGANGKFDEQWIQHPAQTAPVYLEEQDTLREMEHGFDGAAFSKDVEADRVMFKVPGFIQFEVGSNTLPANAHDYLNKMAQSFRSHDGTIVIRGYGDTKDDYALGFGRAMAVRNTLVREYDVNTNKLIPVAAYELGSDEKSTAEASDKKGQVRFILKRTRNSINEKTPQMKPNN